MSGESPLTSNLDRVREIVARNQRLQAAQRPVSAPLPPLAQQIDLDGHLHDLAPQTEHAACCDGWRPDPCEEFPRRRRQCGGECLAGALVVPVGKTCQEALFNPAPTQLAGQTYIETDNEQHTNERNEEP